MNKPSGLFVHPYKEESQERDTLMRRLKEQTKLYLYPMHRLDRPVSGIVIFALSSEAARALQEQWTSPTTIKEYITLVRGILDSPGRFEFALTDDSGIKRDAVTHYWPLDSKKELTLLRVRIDTGRKHQIRRHFARRCHGVIGDTAHGKGKINQYFRDHYQLNRIFLHCHYFSFEHPFTKKKIEIHCPLPIELQEVLTKLEMKI